jgi:hypothetical protein
VSWCDRNGSSRTNPKKYRSSSPQSRHLNHNNLEPILIMVLHRRWIAPDWVCVCLSGCCLSSQFLMSWIGVSTCVWVWLLVTDTVYVCGQQLWVRTSNTNYIHRQHPQKSKRTSSGSTLSDQPVPEPTVNVDQDGGPPPKKRREVTHVIQVQISRSGRHIVQTDKAKDSL